MFTGLVADTGTVREMRRNGSGAHLAVTTPLAAELRAGDSVAVNGVCLTAAGVDGEGFAADVMEETLRRSSLGPLAAGDDVNLELPLRASDRLGGHMVQGHVDGLGSVEAVEDEGLARLVRIRCEPGLLRYVVEKGSIAVDGVSLTVASIESETFTVSLIPETLERTTLGGAQPGRAVNLEVDVLAKYVEKLVSER
jgi:riboflavin synthase